MSARRVLAVLSTGELGGAELSTVALWPHRPDSVELRVVLLSPGPLTSRPEMTDVSQFVVRELPKSSRGRLKLVAAVNREVRSFNPAIVYAVGNRAALASLWPSWLARRPLIWHKCDTWYDGRGAALLSRLCRHVFAPTTACGEAIPRERLTILDPALPIRRDFRVSSARPPATIGSIGRLEPTKGHQDVIAAAGLIAPHVPDLRIVIAGASVPHAMGFRDVLQRVAAAHHVDDRLEFVGHVEPIEQVLERLTLLVSASYRDKSGRGGEAFGLTIAEANWAGLPVVVTDSGGPSEHVIAGTNGFVVPPQSPQWLAAAIRDVLTDPARAARMGKSGARMARERFDPKIASQRLFDALLDFAPADL